MRIHKGFRVAYSKDMIRSLGGTYEISRMRGTVLSEDADDLQGVSPEDFVLVRWDSVDEPHIVRRSSLSVKAKSGPVQDIQ